jgi:hypothetical protein
MTLEATARVRLAKDVLMQKVGDDAILLNLKTENYFSLDEIGTRTPKAKTLAPESFIDVGYLKELEQSGFIKKLYGE